MSLGQEILIHQWTKLATDIFHFAVVSYLLLVDYTSWFPIVHKLNSITAQHVTSHFKLIFSEYGQPDTLISHNGPCCTTKVLINIMQEYNVSHITSSLHYPQPNVLVEMFVQTVRNPFYKANYECIDLFKSFMIYHNTQLTSNLQLPMQILQSRTARSQLPMSNAAWKQLGLQTDQLRAKSKNEELPSHDLCVGQNIMVQDPTSKRWYPVVITSLCQDPKSYKITTTDGVTIRICKPI